MKILKDTLEVGVETWDDPGSYPNSLAYSPLPSYDYVEEIAGGITVLLEPGDEGPDASITPGFYRSLEEYNYELFEYLRRIVPYGCDVNEWCVFREGDTLTITVSEFEASDDALLALQEN